jgi:mannose-1-phosphate guanylyltransferase
LRHLWGVVLPATSGGPLVPRRHYTGPRNRRSGERDAIERITRLIPSDRVVALGSRPVNLLPEVFLAALSMAQHDAHAVVAVLPAEHVADHGHRLLQYVARAAVAASVRPDLPLIVASYPGSRDPEYAWVEPGDPVDGLEAFGVRTVMKLVLRPSRAERSGALLGTVAIVISARTLARLGRRHLPDVLESLEPLEHVVGRPEERLLRDAVWESMPHASLCGDLLAHVQELGVVAMPDAMTGRWRSDLQALAS